MIPRPDLERIEGILTRWKATIGDDYTGYRNHVVRMATFCLMLRPCDAVEQEKIEIAACFHDIGLWTARTLDYLDPSVPPALRYLDERRLSEWGDEIRQMILDHHKLRPAPSEPSELVELFRKADLVDVSLGRVRYGLPASAVKAVRAEFPNAGFHRMLLRRTGGWMLRHPLRPLPMMRW